MTRFRHLSVEQRASRWHKWRSTGGTGSLALGSVFLVLYLGAFVFGECAYPLGIYAYSPSRDAINYDEADLPPSVPAVRMLLDFRERDITVDVPSHHPLGTDRDGRDILIRTAKGTSVGVTAGLIAVGLMLFIGILLGSLTGYYPSTWWESGANFIVNVIESPPRLVVLIIVAAVSGFDMVWFAITLGVLNGARVAHVVHNKTSGLRTTGFIEAARELGLSDIMIVGKHIIWYNCREVLSLQIVFGFISVVLVEATLGFMDYGLHAKYTSWGRMISDGLGGIERSQYWQFVPPAAAIALTLLSLMFIADGLEKRYDIKTTDYL